MNRIRDAVRRRAEGIPPGMPEKKKKNDGKARGRYSDAKLMKEWKKLLDEGKIPEEEYDYLLECWEAVAESKRLEAKYKRMMMRVIEDEPLYVRFLGKVRGIGPVLSMNIIRAFGDCSAYATVSKLWKHTGNDVTEEGIAPKRRKGHKVTFSPKLRRLSWLISRSLWMKNKGFYRKIFDEEKKRQLEREYEPGYLQKLYGKTKDGEWIYAEDAVRLTKQHAHNRALRKMRKIFLDHLWHAAREIAGLPAKKSYVDGILGHENVVPWREALEMEDCLLEEGEGNEKRKQKEKYINEP